MDERRDSPSRPEEAPSAGASYCWTLDPAVASHLRPLAGRFPDLAGLAGIRVLKENQLRTVYLVPPEALAGASGLLPPPVDGPLSAGLIAKVYRYTKRWDRLRYRFLRSRAAQEWVALQRFRVAGLPAPRALGLGELRRGPSVLGGGLLLSFLPERLPLAAALEARLSARESGTSPAAESLLLPAPARSLLLAAGALVRQMHDCGVWHRDLHGGNILVSRGDGSLSLIDLHSCLFLPRLARWQRRRGLELLAFSLRGAAPRPGLGALIEGYGLEALWPGATLEDAEDRLLASSRRLERRRIRSRSRRCFLPSTRFAVERRRGVRLFHQRLWPEEDIEWLWSREPPGRVLKRCRRGWVAAVRVGGQALCVKYRRCSLLEGLQSLVESHRLRRAYGGGHALEVRGIPTPQVVALRERRTLGMVREAHLVTLLIEDGVPLDTFLKGEYWGKPPAKGAAARRKHVLARAAGRLVRAIHQARLYPHDLSPQNLLVSEGGLAGAAGGGSQVGSSSAPPPFLFLIDLDHLYLWKRPSARGRRRNLVQVANLPEGHVSAVDRFRGLKAYADAGAGPGAGLEIARLRAGLLKEHLRTLEAMEKQERELGGGGWVPAPAMGPAAGGGEA